MSDLSKEQLAILRTSGNLAIVAGPGSGKTTVLTAVIAKWMNSLPVDSVLGLTFTNKAATEMVRRVSTVCKSPPRICTFHAYAARFLRAKNPKMIIWDQDDARNAWKSVSEDKFEADLFWVYEFAANFDPEDEDGIVKSKLKGTGKETLAAKYKEIKKAYLKLMDTKRAVDFQQMILVFVRAQESGTTHKYKAVAVDEFQDTSYIQYRMVKNLVGPDSVLTVVGDSDQMLYHWRGANEDNFQHFLKDFKPAVMKLQDNYRSGPDICTLCNNIISHNVKRIKKVTLPAFKNKASVVSIYETEDDHDQALKLARQIAQDESRAGIPFRNMAILYRTAQAFSPLTEAILRQNKIPYKVVAARSFFDRREIRCLIGIMKFAINEFYTEGLLDFSNFYRLGITEKRLTKFGKLDNLSIPIAYLRNTLEEDGLKSWENNALKLFSTIHEHRMDSPMEFCQAVLDDTGAMETLKRFDRQDKTERVERMDEFLAEIILDRRTIEEAVDFVSLASDQDTDNDDDTVKAMTVHAAKGLEWDVVFIIGAEERLFPHHRSVFEDGSDEPERRVFFVACSRAKSYLRILYRRTAANGGGPSRFIREASSNNG